MDYKVNSVNTSKIKEDSVVTKKNFGKGRILLTIDKLAIGAAALFEGLREVPGFEYLKSIGVGNLTTKFNVWIASLFGSTPDLSGLTPEQIYELGRNNAFSTTNDIANSIGLIFSATLEFMIQHPTVTVLGVTTTTTLIVKFCDYIKERFKKKKLSKEK